MGLPGVLSGRERRGAINGSGSGAWRRRWYIRREH